MTVPTLLSPIREVWRLWVGILLPPTAWGIRLLAGWSVAEYACAVGAESSAWYLLTQSALLLSMAVLTVWSGWVGVRVWQGHRAERDDTDPIDTRAFMGLFGALSAAIYLALILVEGSAVYVVPC